MKIISGAQTGADRGGLDAAIELGIDHGGWCPKGRRAEDGIIPDRYRVVETRGAGYERRTELNVIDADVTLIFIDGIRLTGGSRLTTKYCEKHNKPFLVVNIFDKLPPILTAVGNFLIKHKPVVINIAGNRESKAPDIQEHVAAVMALVLMELE